MGNVWISEAQIDQENVRFVDTRFSLQDSTAGQTMYNSDHIENAIYLDLELDLSDMSLFEGRHPMPSKEQLTELFESNGFLYSDQIVIYDQGGMPFAARAYWLFKYAGFPEVYILKEGYTQLKELGYNVSAVKPTYKRSNLTLDWNKEILSNRQSVKLITEGVAIGVLLDARSAERYAGVNEPIDSIAGHIPTARNFDWEQLKHQTTFKSSSEVEDLLQQVVSNDEEITVYCGSGVTAAPLYAMLKEAGYERVKLYVGSYSDWITEYPIEK